MPTTGQWRGAFNRAAQAGCRVSVVDRDGWLLAIANWAPPGDEDLMMGHQWFDFVDGKDLRRVIEWFADDTNEPIIYESQLPDGGLIRVCLVKAPIGQVWLVVGESQSVLSTSQSPFAA